MMNAEAADYELLAHDHLEIADTLYRYAAGLDGNDAVLLASVFTEDAILDGSPTGAKIGVQWPTVSGRHAIVALCTGFIGPLDTSHSVTNVRVLAEGSGASVSALQLAQHYPAGTGPDPGQGRRLLLMSRLDAETVRDAGRWRVRRLTIDNAWAEGDISVITDAAQAAQRQAEESTTRSA
jgi:hypothetical protein